MPKHGPNVWVAGRGGRYTIKEERGKKALAVSSTQRAASLLGRLLAIHNRSEFILQSRKGRIREKDSHGFDKFPPRG